jgi:hypothetical protein
LQEKLKSDRDFVACAQNGIALLSIIKVFTRTFEDQMYLPDTTAHAIKDFYLVIQRNHESLQAYHDRYLVQDQVFAEIGVKLAPPTVIRHMAVKNGHAGVVKDTDRNRPGETRVSFVSIRRSP